MNTRIQMIELDLKNIRLEIEGIQGMIQRHDDELFKIARKSLTNEGEGKMASLELKLLVGSESKQFLASLEGVVSRLEKLSGTLDKAGKAASSIDDGEEDDDFAAPPTKKGKVTKAAFEEEEEAAEEEEEKAPPAKKAPPTKKAKLKSDDVNAACKARVKAIIEARGCSGAEARASVLKLLKKHFKTESVSELEPEQYAEAIKLLNGK